ncbi:TMEM165/GDT1 family protein [Chamaesiphon sp. VAR_69_metabat_338]|uniref:TMEM165/GDT1 family protein n=1 Tax=Chamaesiphon sp. VAR_69_metabat_338 TaxID=2964704 RepID=UPI00286DAC17|nr:TMEM165/GDT1 family protein [Chamaesiphon sp. VAR_69_metabat_338]
MLEAFTAALSLITVSEIGDKTFFMAVILASRYPRKPVFFGVVTALAAMTVLSVAIGELLILLPSLIARYLPANWTFLNLISIERVAALLFLIFGIKLLYSARTMSVATDIEVMAEAEEAIEEGERKFKQRNTAWKIFLESCVLTFVAEWGDRTQFATITLAASQEPIGVMLGGTLGHAICALIAVIGGRAIASHISERTITIIGGVLFILLAIVSLVFGGK